MWSFNYERNPNCVLRNANDLDLPARHLATVKKDSHCFPTQWPGMKSRLESLILPKMSISNSSRLSCWPIWPTNCTWVLCAGAASAGAANAGAASAGAASAGPASKQNPNPNPAVACASAPPVSEPEAEPEPGGGVRFSYRRSLNPKQNPNPAVACASAPPVSEPEAEAEPGGGVRFRYRRSFLLTSTHWPWPSVSCRDRFSPPPSQDAGRSYSPACNFMKMQSGGGSCGGSYSCLFKYNLRYMCLAIMAPVRQFICVT